MEQHEEQGQQAPEEKDISSRTIFVLVLLTLAVSFVGAWVSITSVSQFHVGQAQVSTTSSDSTGRVTFGVTEPGASNDPGQVAFEIVDSPG